MESFVYNWTRDAAIAIVGLAAAGRASHQMLADYLQFAKTCQDAGVDLDTGCYKVDGTPRDWARESDGPALQTLAALRMFSQLDEATRGVARSVIEANLDFLQHDYRDQTINIWEERHGASFSRCLCSSSAAVRAARVL